MAAEVSSLTSVDEDDKDTDPETNASSLLREPMKMAHDSASFEGSFSQPCSKQSIVLDVLSNTDMFSAVGLENGPSLHQATQANELNSISTEREEEKCITQLETVQEIDTAEMWDFDADSPDNTLDNLSSTSDLHWDPQNELLPFLVEDSSESKEEILSNNQRRRKRKMDMVVMVDPSEHLYPDVSHMSSEELSDDDNLVDLGHVSNSQMSKYPNGTVKAIKDILYSSPPKNSHTVYSVQHGLSSVATPFTVKSQSEDLVGRFSCSKCSLTFFKESHLHYHMKSHADINPFICRECGESFRQSGSLIEHMSIHQETNFAARIKVSKPRKKADKSGSLFCPQCTFVTQCPNTFVQHAKTHDKNQAKRDQEKRKIVTEEVKHTKERRRENRARKLYCPQCSFDTTCPNDFVQHAKTHEKDKRNLIKCDKCRFTTLSEKDFKRHSVKHHSVFGLPGQFEVGDAEEFSCYLCSYKVISLAVFRNHLLRLHHQTFEEYENARRNVKVAPIITFPCKLCSYSTFSQTVFENHLMQRHQQTYEEYVEAQIVEENAHAAHESPAVDAEFTSRISINNEISSNRGGSPSESGDFSDLFKNSRIKRNAKSQLTGSKLDKSINVLLSRQHGKETADQKKDSSNCKTTDMDAKSRQDDFYQLGALTVQNEESRSSQNGHTISASSDPRLHVEQTTRKKSSSKRKMSTPYRNTYDQDSSNILSAYLSSPAEIDEDQAAQLDTFGFKESDLEEDFYDNEHEGEHISYSYSRRVSMRGALQESKRMFEEIKTEEEEELIDPEIKEECIETEIMAETFDAHQVPLEESFDESSDLESEGKSCPYCPATFKSGIGLANHIRGHLHRVGLSYKARNVVSAEEVAFQDRKPKIRRRISALRRLKKALQMESNPEAVNSIHSCPLCGDSFDNRTGQSNHIRGHLKKLGRNFSSKKKSPLMLLRELMRDEKECERALRILGRRGNHFGYGASPKLSSAGPFTPSIVGIAKSSSITKACAGATPLMFSFEETKTEKTQEDTNSDVRNSLSGNSALIGILKKRKCQEDARLRGPQVSKNTSAISSNSEHTTAERIAASPNSASENEFNRKVCIHCNATFHSGVSLSNHLRAYEKRKRTALLEGTTFDCCKVSRRQRSRPGSKKKTMPLTQTPEDMYRLTCRFCDLVFQGPLSVQEDWIKHLQRHIMNSGVPHTGLGMVEVASPPTDPQTLNHDQDSSPTFAAS